MLVKSFLYLTFNRNCAGFFDKIEIRWKSKKRWKIKKLMAFPECVKVFGFLLWCWVLLTTTLKISTSLAYPTLDSPHIFILQCELLFFFFFFGWVIFFFSYFHNVDELYNFWFKSCFIFLYPFGEIGPFPGFTVILIVSTISSDLITLPPIKKISKRKKTEKHFHDIGTFMHY